MLKVVKVEQNYVTELIFLKIITTKFTFYRITNAAMFLMKTT